MKNSSNDVRTFLHSWSGTKILSYSVCSSPSLLSEMLKAGSRVQFWRNVLELKGFPHSLVSKEFACNAEVKVKVKGNSLSRVPLFAGDPGSIPGSERCPGEGNGNPLRYSCLENPRDGGAWWAAVYGVTQSWIRLKWLSSSSSSSILYSRHILSQMRGIQWLREQTLETGSQNLNSNLIF